ncbi:FIST signal transduction protein [Vreelandella massiliensis]|uniref:FIST signal transduction protein n=1 Tax=Vreelandella massiliensis TaxID=1816686 RepID=UPI00096A7518|nr:FIST C-terminal domain-containing protein [Halomonas massiliensis]MYL25096.1 histidine kinase [Halomonas alkaliantarctica]
MQFEFEPTGTPEAFGTALHSLAAQETIKTVLVFACDENGWKSGDIDVWITDAKVPVVGGLFPQIAFQGKNYAHGTLLIGLYCSADVGVVRELSDADTDFESILETWADHWPLEDHQRTHCVLVDGLASRISALVESLFFTFGLEHNFIGGGAGSLSFEQRPCLITPQGLLQDAALVISLPIASYIGVTHGWSPISDSAIITQSERNVIKSIDWQPAAQVYREWIHAYSGDIITPDNFFSIAKSYPLGIVKLGTEVVVRDPLAITPEGELVCVGEVPEGCAMRLLHGNPQALIEAAISAREQALEAAPSAKAGCQRLLIDCISRVLFLGDDLSHELEAVSDGMPVFGAFTLGEIANSGSDYLEFYNKTTVLGILDS